MKAVEWQKLAPEWTHLKDVKFLIHLPSKKIVDMLIRFDQSEMHATIREVRGKLGEPTARLTPLGGTCVGKLDISLAMLLKK